MNSGNYKQFRNPQALGSALAILRMPWAKSIGFLNYLVIPVYTCNYYI